MKVRPSFHSSRLNNHLSRRFVSRHLKLLSVLFVLIAAVLVTNVGSLSASKGTSARRATAKQSSPGAARKPGTQSVASVLNEDGSVKPGVNGSFDVSGFRMGYAPNGAPRFVPAAIADGGNCVSGAWDTQFGLRGVNGPVYALAAIGTDLYVGGSFDSLNFGSEGTQVIRANGIAKFNTTTNTWSALSSGGVNSSVNALAVMGSDLYVGGSGNIAKFNTTTSTWSTLGKGNGHGVGATEAGTYVSVNALAVIGSDLYVGGAFNVVNFGGSGATPAVPANGIAKFDTTTRTWTALGNGSGNGIDAIIVPTPYLPDLTFSHAVSAMTVMGSDLYVGGNFTIANYGGSWAVPAKGIAKYNTTTRIWSALSNGNGNGVSDSVSALAVMGSDLYVGGRFTTVNVGGSGATPAVPANNIAKFSPATSTWSALSNGNGNGVSESVYALAMNGSDLYIGGKFTTVNVGGDGTTPEVIANHTAKFNLAANTWSALSNSTGNGVSGDVYVVAINESDLYVGGDFTFANIDGGAGTSAVIANHFAKFNTTTSVWSAVINGNQATSTVNGGTLYGLAVNGNDLYISGDFTSLDVGGSNGAREITANHIAKFNTTTNTWSALGSGNGNGVDGGAHAMAVLGNDLYVGGGTIANYGGSGATPQITVNYIAKFNTTTNTWSALNSGNGNGLNGGVSAMAVLGNDLYVAGGFTIANYGGSGATPQIAANNIAKFNTTTNTWSAISSGNGNGLNGGVSALAVLGNDLYVGGDFTRANYGGSGGAPEVAANHIAKFNPTTSTWSALSSGNGNGVNNVNTWDRPVHALAVMGNDLYVGGYFETANVGGSGGTPTVAANNIAKFDTLTNTWSALSYGNGNGVKGYVYTLAVMGSDLYVGGRFTTANVGGSGATPQIAANNIAKFNATANTWGPLRDFYGNPGTDRDVRRLAVMGSDLYVGGDFSFTGNIASTRIARWLDKITPPSLLYTNRVVALNGSLTLQPAEGPRDDGTVSTIAVQSVGTYTGGISVDNASGVVSISNAAPLGTHNITIRATDDCGAVTDASFMLSVTNAATTTTVSSSVNPSYFRQDVTFTATVTSTAGGTPTGTVQFKVDGVNAGAAVALNASGVTTFTTSSLYPGTHAITADYSGDATFNPGTGTLAPDQQIDCPKVTNSNDSGPGSLRDIITNLCPGMPITFDMTPGHVTSPINLTSGELLIDKSLTIQGPGPDLLTVTRNGSSDGFRIFNITSGVTVNISGLSVSNGIGHSPEFSNYVMILDGGGGISNRGTLTISNSTITGNRTAGGGCYYMFSGCVDGCVPGGYGGGIFNIGTLTITNSTISSNTTGAGFFHGCHGSYSVTPGGNGGGISNSGTLTISSSTIVSNETGLGGNGGDGGGISNTGTLTIFNSTINGNQTGSGGDSIGHSLEKGGGGGGISNAGTLSIINTTISDNVTGNGGYDAWGCGGCYGSAGAGGGIIKTSGSVSIRNSIIALNRADGGGPDLYGQFTSQGHNLIGKPYENSGFTNGVNGDMVGTAAAPIDPLLAPLANCGGPTQTRALLPSSRAIDAGDNCVVLTSTSGGCLTSPLTTDQRDTGFARQVNGTVDIGAFESRGFTLSVTGGSLQYSPIFLAFGSPLVATVSSASSEPVGGGMVTFTAPSSGASGTFPGNVNTVNITTSGSGVATSPTFTANGLAGGPYNVVASIGTGLPSVNFALTNKGNQTITFGALPNKTFGDPDFIVSATASSALAVSFAASGQCTVSGNSIHLTGSGSCTITASQAGNSNFNPATDVPQGFTIAKSNQTIAFGALANKTFGDPDFIVSATAGSGLPVSFAPSGQCTMTGNTVHLTGSGSCTITASQAGNSNFNPATDVSQGFTIAKSNQTIAFDALPNMTFGDADFTVSATASSALPVSFAASGQCSIGGDTVHITGAGSCTITASQGGNSNFNAAPSVPQSFNIAKSATNTELSSSTNPLAQGEAVTFTATVRSEPGVPTGTVQFTDNGTSMGAPVALDGSGMATLTTSSLTAGTHAITANYSGDVNFDPSSNTLAGDQVVGTLIRFSSPAYDTTESSLAATITVERSGDLTSTVTVDFATPDDSAATPTILPCSTPGFVSARCDFTTATGTLKFAPGETTRTFTVLISQDSYAGGPESLMLTLTNPSGNALLASPSTATLTLADDVTEPATNPIDDSENFVRQHYHDFLNREPAPGDQAGLDFWTNEIESCGTNQACRDLKRQNVSGAFFLSTEFQETGYFIYRTYKAGFGDLNPPTVPVPLRYCEFVRDTQEVRRGVVVGQGNWQAQLDSNKQAYALAFVQRPQFLARYPAITSATAFVNILNANAGDVLTPTERTALISELSVNRADAAVRAAVLMKVAESALLKQQEFSRAFVLIQYFGYLRRNPDAAPEAGLNFAGYDFWLNKLNQFNGNFIQAEMVKAFISSGEYRKRFGP